MYSMKTLLVRLNFPVLSVLLSTRFRSLGFVSRRQRAERVQVETRRGAAECSICCSSMGEVIRVPADTHTVSPVRWDWLTLRPDRRCSRFEHAAAHAAARSLRLVFGWLLAERKRVCEVEAVR